MDPDQHSHGVFLLPAPSEVLSLDFVNTRYWRGSDAPTETLHTLDDLLGWCERTAGVPAALIEAYRHARVHNRHDEAGASVALRAALTLREALFQLYLAHAEGREPAAAPLATLHRYVRHAAHRADLVRHGGRYLWALDARRDRLEDVLAPVLWSAADLLGGTRLARVKRCANDRCQWVFIDDSKSGNRRWCSMSACGNRAKAHRHYHRHNETT